MLEMLNGPLDYAAIDRDKVDQRIDAGRRALADRYYVPGPWVPPKVAAILRKLLAADPAKRFDSAREALRAVQNVSVVSWRRTEGAGPIGTWRGRIPLPSR